MKVEKGEHVCPKCNGKGNIYEAHSHDLPSYQHQPVQYNNGQYSSSYAAEVVCTRCHGKGKIDWVQKLMGEQKNKEVFAPAHNHSLLSIPTNNNIQFSCGGDTILELTNDGFYYKGKEVKDVKNVYKRFNEWLVSSGY